LQGSCGSLHMHVQGLYLPGAAYASLRPPCESCSSLHLELLLESAAALVCTCRGLTHGFK
jgi:hypothetical protein